MSATSVKHRTHGGGGATLCATVDPTVKQAAQVFARAEGKSLSLWLEDLMRDAVVKRQRST